MGSAESKRTIADAVNLTPLTTVYGQLANPYYMRARGFRQPTCLASAWNERLTRKSGTRAGEMARRTRAKSHRRPAQKNPIVVVLAGPNGAGKSTAAPRLLRGALGVVEFLNADLIATTWQLFDNSRPSGMEVIAAGRHRAARRLLLSRGTRESSGESGTSSEFSRIPLPLRAS